MPIQPLPTGAPAWAQLLYWIAIIFMLVGVPLLAKIGASIVADLRKLRESTHETAEKSITTSGIAHLNYDAITEIKDSLDSDFDARIQRNMRAVMGDPSSVEMFVAAFRLTRREETEATAARQAELAVQEHEKRVRVSGG